MKAIEVMNNVEKAKLLHQLFPREIPAFLEFAEGMCSTIKEEEAHHREQWNLGLFTFDFWLSLITQVEKRIEQYGRKLHTSHYVFAEQLFEGYLAMYMVHCLTVYTTVKKHTNTKFCMMADILFSPEIPTGETADVTQSK